MFTGLVREIGKLQLVTTGRGTVRLQIDAPQTAAQVAPGDSVAVDGICLTVTGVAGSRFRVEAVAETRRLTTLGKWRRGRRVHLEPALRVGDPLDGHLMQGHIDGVGVVQRLDRRGGGLVLTIKAAADQRRFLTPKGSVGVDGVSLTVDAGPFTTGFTVNLIPHTLSATHFADLRVGALVNLEMDVLVKAARSGDFTGLPRAAEPSPAAPNVKSGRGQSGLNLKRLLDAGFTRRRSGN